MTKKTFICAKLAIYFENNCFSFFKSTFQVNSTKIIYPKCMQEKLLFNGNNKRNAEKLFQIIIKAIGMGITFDYIKHKYVSFLVLKNEHYNWFQESFPKLSTYLVCQSNKFQQFISGEVVYKYGKACYISVMFMCEEIMQPTICNGESKGPMDLTQRNICLTISLFYKSVNKKLSPFSQQTIQEKKKHVQTIVLSNGQEMTLEKSKCDFDCQDTFQKCFTFKDLCIFRMNSYLQLVPCRTGTHLQVCGEFECNAHFKCPGYYCIPWGYLCNGKWDCPDGYDEANCNYHYKCVDMFHCIGSQMCLHLQQICDKYIDCPFGDDEFLCNLNESPCLVGCNCHQYAILCNNEAINYEKLPELPYVSYHLTFLRPLALSVLKNQFIVTANLTFNLIESVCGVVSTSHTLLSIDVSHNRVTKLLTKCFNHFMNLKTILVRNNSIFTIEKNAFYDLSKLSLINLSHNDIMELTHGIIPTNDDLVLITLYSNPFRIIHAQVFIDSKVKIIHSNNFQICCISKHHLFCTELLIWYNSCDTLIPTKPLLVITIISVFSILISNSVCLIVNLTSSNTGKSYKILVASLFLIHFLFMFYLISLLSFHLQYQDKFVLEVLNWRKSGECIMLFIILLVYNFMEPFQMILFSLARLRVVLYPFDSKYKSPKLPLRITLAGLGVCITCSIVLANIVRFYEITSNWCLPVSDPSNKNMVN